MTAQRHPITPRPAWRVLLPIATVLTAVFTAQALTGSTNLPEAAALIAATWLGATAGLTLTRPRTRTRA